MEGNFSNIHKTRNGAYERSDMIEDTFDIFPSTKEMVADIISTTTSAVAEIEMPVIGRIIQRIILPIICSMGIVGIILTLIPCKILKLIYAN